MHARVHTGWLGWIDATLPVSHAITTTMEERGKQNGAPPLFKHTQAYIFLSLSFISHLHHKPSEPSQDPLEASKQDAVHRGYLPCAAHLPREALPCRSPGGEHPTGVGDLEVEGGKGADRLLPLLRLPPPPEGLSGHVSSRRGQ